MALSGHAEIAGAGFGGLVAAIGLADRGWSVRVHERRQVLQAEGYGIAIQDNMTRIFAALGILDAILAGGMEIDRRDSLNGKGEILLSLQNGLGRYRISRRHIISLLAERADQTGVEIVTGSTVTGANPDGTLELDDHKTCRADLIIAADGINSVIRESLGLMERQVWQKEGGVRMVIPRLPEDVARDARDGTAMIEAWSDKRRILYCPNSPSEVYVILTCMERDLPGRATPIDRPAWQSSFPTMAPLLERISRDTDWEECRWVRFQTIRLKRWSVGRVAILGDAAHAMPPYLGQGAGHAMMNGLGLAVAIDEAPELASALDLWERRERPMTEHTQRWTRIYGATIFLPERLKSLAINAEKHIPWLAHQYSRAATHLPTGCDLSSAS
ncbi:MAG: FAD-dependent monooxygenase [Alphaproteobacteria bacterium]|nr:FAD-dependent monooxygenase [Alphaproteobacteria bacterium]